MRQIKSSVFACVFLLLAVACFLYSCSGISGSFNNDVHEYFDLMTNTAAIEKHEVASPTQKGSGGQLCISSADAPVSVSYYLRNPKRFVFTKGQSLVYGLEDSYTETVSEADGVSVSQDLTDPSIIYIEYSADFLREREGGFHPITEVINLKHPYSLEDFGSYSFPLYCNSVPPLMQGSVCLADNSSPNKAVLFMNLPNPDSLKYIHKDLAYLRIDGRTISIESLQNPGTVTFTGGSDLHVTSTPVVDPSTADVEYSGQTYHRFEGNAVFSPGTSGASGTTLFYETGEPLTSGKSYVVEFIDMMGFTSAVEINASANQIGEVSYENTGGGTLTYKDSLLNDHDGTVSPNTIYGEDGKAYLVLVPPAGHPDAVLSYRVYRNTETTANFLKSGTVTGKNAIIIPCSTIPNEEQTYVIKAYAHKNLYMDSGESTCTIITKPFVYSGNGAISLADQITVKANGKVPSETVSEALSFNKSSTVNISLAAYPVSGSDSITGVEWSWQLLLSGLESNKASPSSGSSAAVSFSKASGAEDFSTTEIYVLRVTATYAGCQNVFFFNVKFTD
ncbi:MAG: hypothetical protein K6E22_12345 [Treponema sp.]|nr:hypothetical protein [Treponema sp.]